MAFLRIAVFEIENAPGDAMEIWDDLIGSALRNNPDCLNVIASRDNSNYAIVSTWISEERFHYWMESKPYVDVIATVAARLGLSASPEPTYLFEGEVPDVD